MLNVRQQRFVDEYVLSGNGADAYRKAGYKVTNNDSAANSADRLLGNAGIRAAVDAGLEARRKAVADQHGITTERLVKEAACVALSDLGDIIDMTGEGFRLRPACEIPESARRCIKSVKVRRSVFGSGEAAREVEVVEFALWDKMAAVEKLGKYLKMFTDKLEISGTLIETVEINHAPQRDDRLPESRGEEIEIDLPPGPEPGVEE